MAYSNTVRVPPRVALCDVTFLSSLSTIHATVSDKTPQRRTMPISACTVLLWLHAAELHDSRSPTTTAANWKRNAPSESTSHLACTRPSEVPYPFEAGRLLTEKHPRSGEKPRDEKASAGPAAPPPQLSVCGQPGPWLQLLQRPRPPTRLSTAAPARWTSLQKPDMGTT